MGDVMTPNSAFYLDQALSIVGIITVLWLLWRAACGLGHRMRTYVLSEVWKGVDLAGYGPWAVVTGATAGIGKAYAHELAKRGLNVVLISRSLEKLKQVAAEIEEQHGRSTRIIQMDFTKGTESYEPVRAALQGLEVGVLVNNVGMSFPRPAHFLDVPNVDKYIPDLVNCNVLSTVKMTQIVLPQMVARKKGIIINMSSIFARRPIPMVLMYSSSKTFMDFFSQALDMEYRSKGIIVQSVLPFFVDTDMVASLKRHIKLSADVFAHKALNTVGLTNRTSGSLTHSIVYVLMEIFFPKWLHFSPFGNTMVSLAFKTFAEAGIAHTAGDLQVAGAWAEDLAVKQIAGEKSS